MAMIIMMDTVGNRERGRARFAVSEYPVVAAQNQFSSAA
jgi:hypothetical protein